MCNTHFSRPYFANKYSGVKKSLQKSIFTIDRLATAVTYYSLHASRFFMCFFKIICTSFKASIRLFKISFFSSWLFLPAH